MISRKLIPLFLTILAFTLLAGAQPAAADSSHARIVRLSLVQGEVRFLREAHGDSMADPSAVWETAEANLPIRQGYAISTDQGRAEIEFENGAMAFLKENTVLEFYDLSLENGARTTRLVLRQGSASFYFNPENGDYFSVTGGDFTVEATTRSSFRLDNYDDGSTLETLKGHVTVVHKDETKRVDKGQSLSMKAGDDDSLNVGQLGEEDDFDRWVSGRVDSVVAATNDALLYTSSPYYAPGFADLYTYGAFSSCGGYGLGWRPFGVGLAWSPFTGGQWQWDPSFGWTWMSAQPWGWAPYHYGGWLFDASCGGWFYSPPLYFGNPGGPGRRFPRGVRPPIPVYRPATAVFVRNGGKLGIVPMHPLDEKGKKPLNLEHGVFEPVLAKGASAPMNGLERGLKWETVKSVPREALSSGEVAATPPVRVSRTTVEGSSGVRIISLGKDSSIAYDPREHRFVNTNGPVESGSTGAKEIRSENGQNGAIAGELAGNEPARPATPSAARSASASPPTRSAGPPPAPRYSGGDRGSYSGRSSSASGSGSTSASSAGRASSSSSTSSASSSHPSGGRPH